MRISTKDWLDYVGRLSKLNDTAGKLMQSYVAKNGFADTQGIIDYAYGLITKYGEGSAALAAEMYDETAALSGVVVPPAEVAETASHNEVAKAVQGTIKQSQNPNSLGSTVGRLVKRAGADTTLKNAKRDHAQFAWVPFGETCAFCLTLASRGFQDISAKSLKNGHAEHIHANCDCAYTVRFDKNSGVKGYDPDKYLKMYEDAEGKTSKDKINAMRRAQYQDPKVHDKILMQKKIAERKRTLIAFDLRTDLEDEIIPKSVGAKSQNYGIMDLKTGSIYHLAEGSKLQDKEVFAGKGKKEPYRDAWKYAEKYGGKAEDWQHVKGRGVIATPDGDFEAEIHWSQCEGIGKHEFFIKRWLE